MTNYVAVLGASNPEMEAIETLLRACGVTVVYATVDSVRVHPGNAYRADAPAELSGQWGDVVVVECGWADMVTHPHLMRADHHRPGDYGYGRPRSWFMRSSSLGQVIYWLARLDLLAAAGWAYDPSEGHVRRGDIRVSQGRHWVDEYIIPHDLVLTAAADHCLGAAYRGECPGVAPDELLAWRVSSRARYQHRVDSERGAAKGDVSHYETLIRERIEHARCRLRDAKEIALLRTPGNHCGGGSCGCRDGGYGYGGSTGVGTGDCYCDCDGCAEGDYVVTARDMRRDTPIDELVEAATRDGVAYVAGPFVGPDGRRKFTVNGNGKTVETFMHEWAPANGLTDIYGDPARGFAGGYSS